MTDPMRVGADIARFMLEALAPSDRFHSTYSNIFMSYQAWCRRQHAVPLASGVFYHELERLADMANIQRTRKGGNLVYMHTDTADVES